MKLMVFVWSLPSGFKGFVTLVTGACVVRYRLEVNE